MFVFLVVQWYFPCLTCLLSDWSSDSGYQHVYTEFLLSNKTDVAVTILKFTSEYWVNGEWKSTSNTFYGNREGGNNYNCRQLVRDNSSSPPRTRNLHLVSNLGQ